MPNGGSDCFGTRWLNRKNHGERDLTKPADYTLPDHCEIGLVDGVKRKDQFNMPIRNCR